MEKGIILRGPKAWAEDHQSFIKNDGNGMTTLQYSAQVGQGTIKRLEELKRKFGNFDLYIYVPKKFDCGGRTKKIYRGNGRVEFKGKVIDFRISKTPTECPWPTVKEPKDYDRYKDKKYEYWFKVNSLEDYEKDIKEFEIFPASARGGSARYTIKTFARAYRRAIAFASE